MTQNQLEWMQQSGLDPAEYDMTPDGRVVRRQVASAPAEPQREVMSPLRAAGTSFLGNVLPSAAGLYAGAQTGALGGSMFGPVGTVIGGIGGGLAGGYGAGKLQEAALEKLAPEALQQLAQAEQDQPVMSYLGGFAPNALAMRPSFGGIKGLTAPLGSMSKEATRAAFLPAAANVGVNVAGSTAGQLVNMSQGGEFSAPRFAADVALGSLFADPTKLGRRFGLTPLKPDVAAAESPMDLAALRTAAAESSEAARVAGEAESARIMDETRGQMSAGGMTGREVELFKTRPEMEWWKQPEATRIADIERVAKETKQRLPKGMVAELAGLPEVYAVVQNPEKFPQFLATSLEEALNAAHARGIQNKFLRPEDAASQGRYQDKRLEVMAQKEALKPTPEETAKAEAIQAENARIEAEQNAVELRKLQDLEAAQALSDEAAERLQVLKSRRAELLYANRGERPNIRQNIREQSDPAITQAKQELADARAIADDLYSRLQRPGGEGLLNQADLDAAAQLAARRGLRIVPATPEQQAQGIRGAYVVNKNGERVIYINPLAATADTAIHEIGHDVFKRSPNERMQRSLMDTAEGSEAYRREYEARLAARDKNGNPVHTEQQARDIALEEGLVQAFGEQHPNVKPGEIRQWFNALKSSVKSMVGMKLSPEDALAWMHYATTEAVPWKGVAVAKVDGTGDETTRYQRGPIDRLRNFSEIDSLESRGGIFSQVAQGMRSYYATRKFMQGQASSKEQAMSSLSPERQVMLGKHIGQEFDQQRFIQPPSEIAAAYNEYRNEWQKFWPTETNKAGHTVRAAGGQRARLTDPYYGPFHMWSDSVRDIITTKQGSPEYVKLKDDYIKQHTQFHQQNGVPLQEAQTRSLVEFNDAIREMSVPYDPTAVGTFAGARKAQGIPLPESWREYNIMKLVENYDRRSAMDYAMQEHMEKSPEIMAALGAEKYFNDQPIPPQIKASVPYIGDDNSVKSILREMSGKPARRPDELASGASRGISSLTIGTVSKATEIPTTMIAGLRYLQASDYLPGTMKFIENLADWSALQERSYASGLNKRDGAQNMRQVAGVIGDASGYMNKFAEGVSKYTGLNALEQGARTIAQGWGEVLVQINKRKAATGDKEAVRMLDTLSPDWRTRSDADLAGQFGQLMQGSYDMTQLPAWMLESGAAPYLTWSKWSAGQYNSFMKFAIEPALQGNVKPLLGHLLIGVMGGAAVEQIREWMNNREGRDVNWSELESWMQENQGELGAEGMKQLSVKLLNMVQNVGTFGIAGDLAKMVTTAAVGGTAQGMATAPVANAVFDTSKKIAAALKAIDDGEDFGLVLRQMMLDVAKSHVQVARVGQNWLDEDENLRYDDRRKRRLFDELTGAPTQSGAFSVNYGNLAEREFERGEITPQTGEEAFSLVSRAREEATTREDYASRIRKFQTSQNQIMPSLERQPMKAARYLSFVEGAEEGAGAETMRRYMTREYENKYRKSLIEGMSGLR
jgi:hypothetical protein